MNKNLGFVKCAISSHNGDILNPKDAANKIEAQLIKADSQKVKVLIFPELSITGYTCQDYFLNSKLLEESNVALQELVKFSAKLDVLFVVGAPIYVSDTLYNCGVIIHHGKILGIVPKQYLPNYCEFYEKRWFSAYTADNNITSIKLFGEEIPFGNIIISSSLGYKLGVEICEDLWTVIPPSSYLALAGANIIANLSASNELVGKDAYRQELIKTQSSRCICAYLYVSSGFAESTSDVVFGGSGYAYENGKKLAQFERFQIGKQLQIFDVDIQDLTNERITNKSFSDSKRNLKDFNYQEISIKQDDIDFELYSLSRTVKSHPFVPTLSGLTTAGQNENCKEIISIQSTGFARRLKSVGATTATIGISGGLDSTLALIVCFEAYKKLDLDPKGILGITMPGFGTTSRTLSNSKKLCKELGITLKEIDITKACIQHFEDIGHDQNIHDITYENTQARERTQILMDLANKNKGILVGTGDLSELVLGWCTYNGDHMSMYGVNCGVPKTLVKHIINWYATSGKASNELSAVLLDIIDTPISPELLPTDGKKVVQVTENSVGPYEVVDFFIYYHLRKKFDREKILYLAEHAFDKYSKQELENFYNVFIKRFANNQFKRNCLPDGPKVGTVAVSPRGDLRAPADVNIQNW